MRVLQGKTLLVLLCGTGLAYAAYTPYYSDNLTSNGGSWSQNGSVSFGSAGMSSSSGGGLVTGNYPSSYVNDYQVQATIQLPGNTSGGYYGVMFRATSNAYAAGTTGATAQGTFYLAEIQNPTFDSNGNCSATLALNRVINGSVTLLYSGATWCANSFTLGVAVNGSTIVLLQNGYFVTWTTDSGIASGQPGVNVRGAPGGNTIGFTWLGPADKTAPNTIDPHNISATSYSDRIDFQWKAPSDNVDGSGLLLVEVFRNGTELNAFSPFGGEFTDNTVLPFGTYTYTITYCDVFGNCSNSNFSATAGPVGTVDPRQVGLPALSTNWGGGGENVNILSGNLNFTLPLLTAKALGGMSLGDWAEL